MVKREDIPRTPESLQFLLTKEPIPLGEESIGVHFRNAQEIDDVKTVIGQIRQQAQKRGEDVFTIGLTGSRTKGRFSYSPQQLFAKKLHPYGNEGVTLNESERMWYGFDGRIPERLMERLSTFAVHLKTQQEQHENLGDIDLITDEALRAFTQFDRSAGIPWPYLPISESNLQYGSPTITPDPSFFYPDIDIVSISTASRVTTDTLDGFEIIGRSSGSAIQVVRLYPMSNYLVGLEPVTANMISQFRPFSSSKHS